LIANQTTLILGAGASYEYGFPLGKGLVDQIIEKLEHPEPYGIYKILADLGHTDTKELGDFTTNLRGSRLDSIDEFLSKQPQFSQVAKKCIAIALIPYEKPEICNMSGWYRYLINCLFHRIRRKEQFCVNKLSIITFNYDRSLEFYLRQSFRHSYNVSESEAERYLGFMDLVHVYGQLGRLSGVGEDSRVYEPSLSPVVVKRAADQIKTFPDIDANTMEDVSDILERSERLYFLGFGYSDLNFDLIRFGDCRIAQIIGTSVGLGDTQKKAIKDKWKIELPGNSSNIVDFLKDYAPLD
jgi:hypothetical protein